MYEVKIDFNKEQPESAFIIAVKESLKKAKFVFFTKDGVYDPYNVLKSKNIKPKK